MHSQPFQSLFLKTSRNERLWRRIQRFPAEMSP